MIGWVQILDKNNLSAYQNLKEAQDCNLKISIADELANFIDTEGNSHSAVGFQRFKFVSDPIKVTAQMLSSVH